MTRRSSQRALVLGLMGLAPLASLSASDQQPVAATAPPSVAHKPHQNDHELLANACNRFAERLYGTLAATAAEELPTCSPGSVAMALAMLLPGARGETAEQIADVLELPEDLRGDRLLRAAARLIATSTAARGDDKPSMRITNDLWLQHDFPVLDSYRGALRQHFGADAHNLDFAHEPDAARTAINRHIARATENRIEQLLEPGTIEPLTRVVLTNALWFKDSWRHQFEAFRTRQEPFTLRDGTAVDVAMMNTTSMFDFAEHEDWQAVVMPFANSTLQLEAIVPADGVDLATAERALLRGEHVDRLTRKSVRIRMPRFRAEASHNLVPALKKLGMELAFGRGADFRGIEATGRLLVSRVEHKVWVDVDENGAEAAAATAVVLKERGMTRPGQAKMFDADRAFAFALRDRKTGLLWFVGRVEDPRANS